MKKQHFTETQIPEGALLGVLGGGVPPGSPNPDPISDEKMLFSHLFSDLAFKKWCHHYLDYNSNKKDFLKSIRIGIFLFLSYSFGTETINTFVHSRISLENHTRFQTKMGKVYTRLQTKTAEKPFGAAHRYIGEYPPDPDNTNSLLAWLFTWCLPCLSPKIDL